MMILMKFFKDVLLVAGLVPSILIVGGFIYILILFLVTLYYFFYALFR
jgi:hypothetical protein